MKITITKDKKNKTYTVPTNWNNVNLGVYMKTIEALKGDEEDLHTALMLIHALTGIPKPQIEQLPVNYIKEINTNIVSLLQQPMNEKIKYKINIKGTKYGFHPQLNSITLGEFVDIEAYIKDGVEKNMHKLLSVLYRPIIKEKGAKYKIEDYKPSEERAELFKDKLTVGDFNGASVFFYALGKELLSYSRSYLKTLKTKTEALKKQAHLQKSGAGIA